MKGVQRKTGKTPQSLAQKPDILPATVHYLNAFNILSASRSVGMGVCPISLSDVLAYAKLFNYDSLDDRHRLVHFVQVADVAYLNAVDKKNGRKNHNTPSGSGQHKGRGGGKSRRPVHRPVRRSRAKN